MAINLAVLFVTPDIFATALYLFTAFGLYCIINDQQAMLTSSV